MRKEKERQFGAVRRQAPGRLILTFLLNLVKDGEETLMNRIMTVYDRMTRKEPFSHV